MYQIGDRVTRRSRPATFFGYIGQRRACIRYDDVIEYRTVQVATLRPAN